jgi:hypothetical protein
MGSTHIVGAESEVEPFGEADPEAIEARRE